MIVHLPPLNAGRVAISPRMGRLAQVASRLIETVAAMLASCWCWRRAGCWCRAGVTRAECWCRAGVMVPCWRRAAAGVVLVSCWCWCHAGVVLATMVVIDGRVGRDGRDGSGRGS